MSHHSCLPVDLVMVSKIEYTLQYLLLKWKWVEYHEQDSLPVIKDKLQLSIAFFSWDIVKVRVRYKNTIAVIALLCVIPLLSLFLQAFSAYYFVMHFLNLTDTSIPLETVKRNLARYCETPWDRSGSASLMHHSQTYFSIHYICVLSTVHLYVSSSLPELCSDVINMFLNR